MSPFFKGRCQVDDIGSCFLPGSLIHEISLRTQPQNRFPAVRIHIFEHVVKFFGRPNIKLAFLPLAVGVFGGIKCAFRGGHVPQDIGEDLLGCLGKQGIPGDLEGFQIGGGDHGLIVEHFFKMRQKPFAIGGITMKTEADMIPYSSQAHGC